MVLSIPVRLANPGDADRTDTSLAADGKELVDECNSCCSEDTDNSALTKVDSAEREHAQAQNLYTFNPKASDRKSARETFRCVARRSNPSIRSGCMPVETENPT